MTLRLPDAASPLAALFAEDQARYLIATADAEGLLTAAQGAGVTAALIGGVGGEAFAAPGLFNIALGELGATNEGWLPAYMGD
jgi:hypothetical protein